MKNKNHIQIQLYKYIYLLVQYLLYFQHTEETNTRTHIRTRSLYLFHSTHLIHPFEMIVLVECCCC